MKYSELRKNDIYIDLLDDRTLLQFTGFSFEVVEWGIISKSCQFWEIDSLKKKVVGTTNRDFVEDDKGDYYNNYVKDPKYRVFEVK